MPPIRIGYVGVGLMGLPMVKRLVSLGYDVVAYDIVDKQVHLAAAAGARGAASASEVVLNADFVLLNLPTTDAVEQVVFGPDGVANAIELPQLVIDFSTNEVARGKGACRLRLKLSDATPPDVVNTGMGWWLPKDVSTFGWQVDLLFYVILALTGAPAWPMVPSTSGWPRWPIRISVRFSAT